MGCIPRRAGLYQRLLIPQPHLRNDFSAAAAEDDLSAMKIARREAYPLERLVQPCSAVLYPHCHSGIQNVPQVHAIEVSNEIVPADQEAIEVAEEDPVHHLQIGHRALQV